MSATTAAPVHAAEDESSTDAAPRRDRARGCRPAEGSTSWRLSPLLLVRVAGRSADAAEAVRTPELHAWAAATLAQSLDIESSSIAQHLEQYVGVVRDEDVAVRRALLAVRRDVFNGRHPRAAALAAVAGVLPADVRTALDAWCASVRRLEELHGLGASVEERSLAAARSAMLPMLGDDAMRSAALLQSEDLESAMDRYLGRAGRVDKRDRKTERTLVDLLLRSSLKTSPFSTLTSVGVGRVAEERSPTGEVLRPHRLRQHSWVSVNVAVAARLAAHICSSPALRAPFAAMITPGADVSEDLVRYARRRVKAAVDPDAVVAVDGVHEDLYLIPSGPALRRVASLAATCGSLAELTSALRRTEVEDRPEDVEAFVGHLLRVGFLVVPALQVDAHSATPVRDLAATLAATADERLRMAAALLEGLVLVTERYATAPARDRRGLLAEAREAAVAAFAALGADQRLVPRTVLYEDTTQPSGMVVGRDLAVGMERALAPLSAILPAFDVNLPRRLVLEGYFRARYGSDGRCDDLLQFCHEFQRDFFSPYTDRSARRRTVDDENVYVPLENTFRQAEMTELDDARSLAGRLVAEAHAAAPAGAAVVDLPTSFAEDVARALPDVPATRHAWSYFVQLVATEEGTSYVVNSAYSAHHAMWSRFLHALEAGGQDVLAAVRENLVAHAPAGAVLAEIRGGQDTSNLNLHPVMTAYEIVSPGDVSRRPKDEQIELTDLVVVHDHEVGGAVLRSRRLDRRVIPVYLGFLMPMALPEVQQVLLCFSPTGMAQLDFWAGTHVPVPRGGVARYPRLTMGPLVLQRALWKVDVDAFPRQSADETGSAHYLRVEAWRRAHGMPDLVFARTDTGGRSATADDAPAGDDRPRGGDRGRTAPQAGRKPLPVDFRSALAVQALDRLVRGAAHRLVLTEALPDPSQLACRDGDGRRWVTELLVETYPEELTDGR